MKISLRSYFLKFYLFRGLFRLPFRGPLCIFRVPNLTTPPFLAEKLLATHSSRRNFLRLRSTSLSLYPCSFLPLVESTSLFLCFFFLPWMSDGPKGHVVGGHVLSVPSHARVGHVVYMYGCMNVCTVDSFECIGVETCFLLKVRSRERCPVYAEIFRGS